ncbi:hypothetical protein PENSTE_c007G05792 [Penicillium steckii]|uniref:feruloyl esterase n=1 Tax=Penicillium steckii TaxID=303698 RepID=A0A1V6TFC2_9EURO|nr:hypothetical protein PENSTE_c007G05792 [Penicillium steckii]
MLLPSLLSLALATAGASWSLGCSKEIPSRFPQPGQSTTLHLPGTDREYRLYIPSTYDTHRPTPLYFSFHGATRDMYEEEDLSQFSNPFFNKDGIIVYPNSKNGYWLSNPNANTSRPNDLDFTNDLLTHLESLLCIDSRRVYSAGKSNGGGFTAVIACNATVGSRFAAFASVSGAYYNTDNIPGVGPCEPAERKAGFPFVEFHSVGDTTAPIDGNNASNQKLPVIGFLEGWAERNGCGENAKWARNETIFENPLVKHASWDCAGKHGIVQHYRESGNGHCWPSTVGNDDYKNHPLQCPAGKSVFNATEYIFDFFSGYRLEHEL